MLKLKLPVYSYPDALALCRDGITGNKGLLQNVNNATTELQIQAQAYEASGATGELYTIQPLQNQEGDDPIVLGQLKKSDLIKLYGNYVVGKKKPARAVYDSLMIAADEKCPFCGGIGRPRNLDHYLPKAHFPQFSIVPVNLVPSCRDCNMDGKGEDFAATEAEQVIQPYLDDVRYFNEQWLFARYLPGNDDEPGVIEYFVSPPEHWEDAQKQRVEKHFKDFDLSLRFSKEAGPRLVTLLAQYQALLDVPIDAATSKSIIFQRTIDASPFVNHWERVMCLSLMEVL
ncbi:MULTISPECIES: HNH endonuclease [Vibrio]|uniref:HNH endonuclease n=1 Tax=Vibrio TaxID=662 RepID=UPI001880B70B|nr:MULTISPECIES: HNH endonuclease signature motif containing protein [Vibrio]EJM7152613.1 HNH endonuclease [Vibrio parahaemolyticus]MBE8568381.1 HNH endonuclease [Vibrio sp. OPT46]MBE8580583.1 HNH endonuclease [Vibrio sp. OPT41]MCQ9061326.1 HNH endonuclease [Vibrio alginolyticus]MCS0396993.1 HNH endonuclease [Vibrio diabolicus]